MCKENMELYQLFRACPAEAQKPIMAGRLKGKTDINPMWRIKMLTEVFGPCGFGWVCRITDRWIDSNESTGEKICNVRVELKVKYKDVWSEPIEGIGGAMFIENERNGVHTDDDCYKKAYTDAISVACKALGIAADIYYAKDPDTKYSTGDLPTAAPTAPAFVCADCGVAVDGAMAARTQKAFGVCLCRDCGIKRSQSNEG